MAFLIGIDIGTTNVKAVLLDSESGQTVRVATLPTPVEHPRPEWSQFDPLALWRTISACLRDVAGAADSPRRIAGIAVASMGEAGLPIDGNGEPLYPIMSWHDPRGLEYVVHWRNTLGADRIYEITGMPLGGIFGINRILWLAEHHPDLYSRMACWLSVEDYVLWRLSGAYVTDYTVAARTMAFDPAAGVWSPHMLEAAGIDRAVLPAPYPSGTCIGGITAAAATETGLPQGTPVVTGGHDHLCGALAAGVVEPGMLLDSTGTSQAVVTVTPNLVRHPALARAGQASYNHVVPGVFVVMGGLISGGKIIQWFIDTFYDLPPTERYAAALAEAEESPAVSGVFWLPHLLGNGLRGDDVPSRAACVGLDAVHTRGAILRGLLESLGYSVRQGIEAMIAAGVPPVHHAVAIGGGTHGHLLLQVKADTIGRPVHAPRIDEAVAVGAALLAGLGSRVFDSVGAALASLDAGEDIYRPDPAVRDIHDRAYQDVYVRLYGALRDVNGSIAALRSLTAHRDRTTE